MLTCESVFLLTNTRAVQFYKTSDQYGAALAIRKTANGTEIFLHLEAPTAYQWAAVGTGDKMDKSFMILMQPSSAHSGKRTMSSCI